MNLNDKIFIAGHKGLVGSAILRKLEGQGFQNIVTQNHSNLDLKNQAEVQDFFNEQRPHYVILAAAKVGGIHANNSYPADFIYDNLMIQSNVIYSAFKYKTKRLLFLGSSCIYPKLANQPIQEDKLLSGYLEASNEPYAIAKISGIKLCESFNRQHDTDFRCVMPTNLYGINDNFHSENSHVIPALIKRFHDAKVNNLKEVIVWGDGTAMREFLYVDDMAEASIFILQIDKKSYQKNIDSMLSHINIGSSRDVSILELAETVKKVIGFKGKIIFDSSRLNGTPRKLIDSSKINSLGWKHKTNLTEGLKKTYTWYKDQLI